MPSINICRAQSYSMIKKSVCPSQKNSHLEVKEAFVK